MRTLISRCEFCGRELPTKAYALIGSNKPVTVTLPCDCDRARDAQREEERQTERKERAEAFARAWQRVGIPKMFEHVDADFEGAGPVFSGKSLYICGDNGRGKTHEACRIAKAYLIRNTNKSYGVMACRKTAKFVTAQELFSRLKQSWDRWDETEEDVFQRWAGVDLLVLDDLGKGVPTEWAAENVFRLVDARWSNGRPMVITSQYPMEHLADRYERASAETMLAMISRLGGWCEVSTLGGPDLRISSHTL